MLRLKAFEQWRGIFAVTSAALYIWPCNFTFPSTNVTLSDLSSNKGRSACEKNVLCAEGKAFS